jgi:hypothetical protein
MKPMAYHHQRAGLSFSKERRIGPWESSRGLLPHRNKALASSEQQKQTI